MSDSPDSGRALWMVVRDWSGHHRALYVENFMEEHHELIESCATYLRACELADRLNMIAEVQDG